VNISAPKPLEPTNTKIPVDQQPLTLLTENAGSTGVRPLSTCSKVAADAGFKQYGVRPRGRGPGDGGRTSIRLPDRLAPERKLFLACARGRTALTPAPTRPPRASTSSTPIVIERPELVAPDVNSVGQPLVRRLSSTTRRTPDRWGPSVLVRAGDSDSFANRASWRSPSRPSNSLTAPQDSPTPPCYYWHVRALTRKTLARGP